MMFSDIFRSTAGKFIIPSRFLGAVHYSQLNVSWIHQFLVNSSGPKFLFHIQKCHIMPVAWVLEHLSNLVKRGYFRNIHMIHRCTRRWARPISLWMVRWNKGHWVAAHNPGVLTFVNRNFQKRWNGCFQKYGKTPKSWILIGFSVIFTIHFGVPLFLETPKCWLFLWDEWLGQLSRNMCFLDQVQVGNG